MYQKLSIFLTGIKGDKVEYEIEIGDFWKEIYPLIANIDRKTEMNNSRNPLIFKVCSEYWAIFKEFRTKKYNLWTIVTKHHKALGFLIWG